MAHSSGVLIGRLGYSGRYMNQMPPGQRAAWMPWMARASVCSCLSSRSCPARNTSMAPPATSDSACRATVKIWRRKKPREPSSKTTSTTSYRGADTPVLSSHSAAAAAAPTSSLLLGRTSPLWKAYTLPPGGAAAARPHSRCPVSLSLPPVSPPATSRGESPGDTVQEAAALQVAPGRLSSDHDSAGAAAPAGTAVPRNSCCCWL
mmetsp:Transcript_13710/g.41408  ORF Transcript_13710/g.41408 Transcript_13710/m.41408 type:complete len:205 (-) Transcript_13710:3207-3821(-)